MDESTRGFYHEPVLIKETLGYLLENKDSSASKIYVDCTLGGGGYTKKILEIDGSFTVIAIDKDINAIEHSKEVLKDVAGRVNFVQGNFGDIKEILNHDGIKKISGIVLDLGLSTYQLSHEEGFSYQRNTELDMRADKSQKLKARDILNNYDEKDLARIFYEYGELKYSRKIASDIVNSRKAGKIEKTFDLVEIMKKKTPPRYLNKDLSKLFQAIRIEVNNEMGNLDSVLGDSVEFLETGARIAAVSYHSLEDRIVKNFFRQKDDLKVITKKLVKPSDEEISKNVRARSAKLRVAEKI